MATKGVGTWMVLQFDAACILTHHATNLILPGGTNITTAAGDVGFFYEYGVGTWLCINYSGALGDTTINGTATVTGTLDVTGVTTVGGNIVSDTDSTDDIGTTGVRFANLFVDDITVTAGVSATTFTGALSGNATTATSATSAGTATSATTATNANNINVADESSDTSSYILFTTAATGNLPPKSGSNLLFNSATGRITATSFAGTVATAAQTSITSLGTLTSLTVDNITINGAVISSSSGAISFSNENLSTTGSFELGNYSASGTTNGKFVDASNEFTLFTSVDSTSSVNHVSFKNPNGHVGEIKTSGSATTYSTSSDGQLKVNRTALESEIDIGAIMDSLTPYAFDWLKQKDGTAVQDQYKRGHGLIAQDVFKVLPWLVSEGEGAPGDADYKSWGVDYSKLTIYLLSEVKDLRSRVAALEAL